MLTRRNFIEQIAATGGVSLAYDSLHGLGLMAASESVPFNLRGTVSGVRVAVIGGGLAGLTVAYELEKLGYTTHVLEARPRPGGRVLTVRRGTVSEEEGSTQTCSYDEGQYFNPGPMRIAYHHDTTLAYCRELGVPLEVFAVNGDNAFFYPTKGTGLTNRRVRMREVRADIDGYVSELLSKATAQNVLDDVLTKDDRQRLLDYLRAKGRLTAQGKYAGNIQMRGPDEPPAADGVEQATPHALSDLLGSRMLNQVDLTYEYQPTMFQVVGGMDHLPRMLAARVKGSVTYNAAAREIRQHEQGVTVTYADKGGALRKLEADYLVCALPLPLLAEVDTDFTPEFKALVSSVPYAAAGKIGLQFKRRFWEEDHQIFGGASKTDMDITQIVYPSSGYLGKKGTLVGYYLQGQSGRPVGETVPAARLALALEQGTKIHPQYATEFEHAFSVAWHRVKWNKGSWSATPAATKAKLREPQGRVFLAGDHLDLNAWMQGAFESARHVATAIHARAGVSTRQRVG